MCVETDWDTELLEPYNVFELPEGGEALGWKTPDPGFHQLLYSNEELNDDVDFSNLSDNFDESDYEISNPSFSTKPKKARISLPAAVTVVLLSKH